ncbi:hypothetical protein GE09DRAFT_180502 [Coniochaeta sp. 2T2.1]|nr:hypothetical protein GE09DRAFT_180502 [Coniochaeta sp. 2T2.1]
MDDEHAVAESHNLKFIIPKLNRPRSTQQPGLEVARYAEDEASSSPQVLDTASHYTLDSSVASSSPHVSHRQVLTRGTSRSSTTHHPGGAPSESAHSRYHSSQRSHSLRSAGSEAPIAVGDDASQPGVAGKQHRQLQGDYKSEDQDLVPPSKGRRRELLVLGLPTLWFWILVSALVVVVAVGLGVGLAVGLGKNNTPTSSSSSGGYATPTNQGTQGLSSPAPVNPYCPAQNGGVVTPYDASGSIIRLNNESPQSFTLLCNTYFPAKSGLNSHVRDILVVFAPDLYACVQLCASYNAGYSDAVGDDVGVGGGICVAAALEKVAGGFCHLQNATGGINDTTTAAGGAGVDSAVLVGEWSGMDEEGLVVAFGGNLPENETVTTEGNG